MDYGVHLPLIALDGQPLSLRDLLEYTETAERLGFRAISAECAEKLAAYQAAGARRIFLWPAADEVRQLAVFRERVADAVCT